MRVDLTKVARKQLRRLGRAAQIIVIKRLGKLGQVGVDEKSLKGFKFYFRSRVGDYRIIYQRKAGRIIVIQIGHRREIYRLLQSLLG